MEKNKVWRIMTKDQVPADRRLLGTAWVFMVEKNGILKARLVTQSFAQIPGIDFTDNFSQVIYETIFRITFVLWGTYNWKAEIIDIEIAFLYGDLEEEIYMKILKGYSEYKGMD